LPVQVQIHFFKSSLATV